MGVSMWFFRIYITFLDTLGNILKMSNINSPLSCNVFIVALEAALAHSS